MNRYISKSNTTSNNTIDRQYKERGQFTSIIITILNCNSVLKLLQYCNSYSHTNKAYVVVVDDENEKNGHEILSVRHVHD